MIAPLQPESIWPSIFSFTMLSLMSFFFVGFIIGAYRPTKDR